MPSPPDPGLSLPAVCLQQSSDIPAQVGTQQHAWPAPRQSSPGRAVSIPSKESVALREPKAFTDTLPFHCFLLSSQDFRLLSGKGQAHPHRVRRQGSIPGLANLCSTEPTAPGGTGSLLHLHSKERPGMQDSVLRTSRQDGRVPDLKQQQEISRHTFRK